MPLWQRVAGTVWSAASAGKRSIKRFLVCRRKMSLRLTHFTVAHRMTDRSAIPIKIIAARCKCRNCIKCGRTSERDQHVPEDRVDPACLSLNVVRICDGNRHENPGILRVISTPVPTIRITSLNFQSNPVGIQRLDSSGRSVRGSQIWLLIRSNYAAHIAGPMLTSASAVIKVCDKPTPLTFSPCQGPTDWRAVCGKTARTV